MCGIVGLFLKNPALRPHLGSHIKTMLIGMTDRGPDSAGIAVYHKPVAKGQCKLTAFHADPHYHWREIGGALGEAMNAEVDIELKSNHAVITIAADEAATRAWLHQHHPEVRIMGYGQLMEVYKDMGLPVDVAERYGLGAHGGHPRHRPHPHGDRERGDDGTFPSLHRRVGHVPRPQRLAQQPQPPARMAAPPRSRIRDRQ